MSYEWRGASGEAHRAQRELDFGDAARLTAHLGRCGLADAQARLVGLVVERGAVRTAERLRVLEISSRAAARLLGVSDRAVAKAAATLARREWFRVLAGARGKPPTYVVDAAAAASLVPLAERLDEQLLGDTPLAGANRCEPVRTGANRCEPVRTAARVLPGLENQNPCSHPTHPTHSTGSARGAQRFAPVRSPLGGPAAVAEIAPPRQLAAELPAYPWSRAAGVSDEDLVTACRRADVPLLRHLYEHAVQMEWIREPSGDTWLRFLTACHHAATARLARRMGRLVAFVRQGLDVSRCRQASDQWAAAMLAREHRDPALARRLCGED